MSLIIPYFNGDRWLNETLESLASQTTDDWELIVVEDASTSAASVAALPWFEAWLSPIGIPIRFVCHDTNKGLSAARNTGAIAARGEWILFLDPDDTIAPTAIEKLALRAALSPSFGRRHRTSL